MSNKQLHIPAGHVNGQYTPSRSVSYNPKSSSIHIPPTYTSNGKYVPSRTISNNPGSNYVHIPATYVNGKYVPSRTIRK